MENGTQSQDHNLLA